MTVLPEVGSALIESTSAGDAVAVTVVGDGIAGWTVRLVQEQVRTNTDEPVPVSDHCLLQMDLTGAETRPRTRRRSDVPHRTAPSPGSSK